ncbi:MAG: hypothetical protein QXJ55_08150 [Candidatus Caldarchaeum sp.]
MSRERGRQHAETVEQSLTALFNEYEATIASLQNENNLLRQRVEELERYASMLKEKMVSTEGQLGQVQDEVRGLLSMYKGTMKQVAVIVFTMAKIYGTLDAMAKALRPTRIPWTTIALAAFGSVVAGSVAYVLSQPENLKLLTTWLSITQNQVFVGITVVASVIALTVITLRRRRKAEA